MKAKEVEVGGRYLAKVSNRIVTVRVEAIPLSPITGRKTYTCTNEVTGRTVSFGSAAKFRGRA